MNTINKRLIKTPKVYFEDIALAVRFQGWTEFEPLFVSPSYGHLMENLVYSEISRFFINNILEPKIYFVRNKEKIEIDFLLELPNQKFIAIEVKSTARDYSTHQLKLLESLDLNIVAQWIVCPQPAQAFGTREVVSFSELLSRLSQWI